MNTRKLIVLCGMLLIGAQSIGQTFADRTYTEDNSNFANPERGFYHHTEVRSSSYSFLDENELASYKGEGVSLILRVFYLDNFRDAPLTQTLLDNIRQDFNTARKAGVKVITRFAYTSSMTAPFGDATPERVLQHIKQLGPVLRENSDMIAVLQAGFVGAWGEWYYTDHFSQQVGNPNEADWQNRRAIVNAMLEELPADRSIQARTPQIKRKLVQNTDALTEGEAFANTQRARIGHHNDCFLASQDDYGTYIDQADEKPYLEAETQYVPMGGETCNPYVPLSECPNALEQMKRFHWSYINRDYHPEVVGGWGTNGCLDDVEKKVGYRFRLKSGHLQETSKPGGEVTFSVALANDGWASPFNKRLIEIVLRNKTTNKEYRLTLPDDARRWLPSENIDLEAHGGLPANIEEGEYDVFLNLPAPEFPIRKRPEYSIRFANTNGWEQTSGYNKLNHTLVVDAGASVPTYGGSNFFLNTDELPETLPAPSPLVQSSFGTNVLLYWGWNDDNAYRIIQRSEGGGEFTTIATLPPSVFSYVDKELTANTTYSYRSYLNDQTAVSPMTGVVEAETQETEPPFYTHTSDGAIDEWAAVRPLGTLQYDDQTIAFRLFADKDSLYYHIRGDFDTYELRIDADNSGEFDNTLTEGIRNGIDVEGSILLSDLDNLGDSKVIGVSLAFDEEELPLAEFIIPSPPPPPVGFEVEVYGPLLVIVSWEECLSCMGVRVERSTSADAGFVQVKEVTGSTYIFYDDKVVEGQTYYYRAAAFNEMGLSEYTTVISATPGVTTGLHDEHGTHALIYPNPVTDVMTVRLESSNALTMYDALGRVISPKLLSETREERKYDVSALASGLYVVIINNDRGTTSIRIKK